MVRDRHWQAVCDGQLLGVMFEMFPNLDLQVAMVLFNMD